MLIFLGWLVLVLVLVDPGFDTEICFQQEAVNLLFWHSYEWSSRKCQTLFGSQNHHVEGTYVMDHKFESIRGLYFHYGDEDEYALTTHPLRDVGTDGVGQPCRYCDRTGVRPLAFAANPCPMCRGERVQLREDVAPEANPGIFPMAFINLDAFPWLPSAVVTPDGRWHDNESAVRRWERDWTEQIRRLAADYRHCYGVCMSVKW